VTALRSLIQIISGSA